MTNEELLKNSIELIGKLEKTIQNQQEIIESIHHENELLKTIKLKDIAVPERKYVLEVAKLKQKIEELKSTISQLRFPAW